MTSFVCTSTAQSKELVSNEDIFPEIPRTIEHIWRKWRCMEIPCGRYGVNCLRLKPPKTNFNFRIGLGKTFWDSAGIFLWSGAAEYPCGTLVQLVPMSGHKQPWSSWKTSEYIDVKFDVTIGRFWVEIDGFGWKYPHKIEWESKLKLFVNRQYNSDPHDVAKIINYDDGWSDSMIFALLRIRTLLLSTRAELFDSISSSPIKCICSSASLWFFQCVCSFLLCVGSH